MTALTLVSSVDPASLVAIKPPAGDLGIPAVAARAPESVPDLRLIIEEDEATGSFIYKTLDRATGEIVRQLPREEVLRLKADEAYAAGDVAETIA